MIEIGIKFEKDIFDKAAHKASCGEVFVESRRQGLIVILRSNINTKSPRNCDNSKKDETHSKLTFRRKSHNKLRCKRKRNRLRRRNK
jgi:hypothetical protein